ncbi:RHS repeat-associated core domain-containing protein [Vibrio sagamiensis]|uniref:RHS repeat-associated core domain-containing protein n=1 Tax=Vibrio sagamiensis NBRC 104589 TaxID=1219064 RepID=A0A511QBL3_9VIBR|nr:RHS repeat-associated core domain-containing protein [Vibrio sagamiensis]PNQ62835.1 RHS repeat-associated core domain-containing protein [Vibrio agarivorans]GEM74683.1 hypothetical protein VSA01S_07950 [Vibrio sagamiensis NBRC 104589]
MNNHKDSVFITPLNRREFLIKIGQTTAVAGGVTLLPASVRLAMAQSITKATSQLGFNGEWLDPILEGYHLGQGYRLYQPNLMRFNVPDSLAPFNQGVHNAYAYCHNDPINFTDPSGHLNIKKILFGVFGIITGAIGILTAAPSGGASLLLAAGIISGAAGMIGGSLQIASGTIDDGNISHQLDMATVAFDVIGVISGSYSAYKSIQNIRWVQAGGALEDVTQPGLASRLLNKVKPPLKWVHKTNPAMRLGQSEGRVIATKVTHGGKTLTYTPPSTHGGYTKVILDQVKVGPRGFTIYKSITTAQSIAGLGWKTVSTIPGRFANQAAITVAENVAEVVIEGRNINPVAVKTQMASLEETRQRIKLCQEAQQRIRQLPLS